MSVSFKERVTALLKQAVGEDARIQLDDAGRDSLSVVVVSTAFTNQTGNQRQERIWKCLDTYLSPSECARVVFIETDTPEEHEAPGGGAA